MKWIKEKEQKHSQGSKEKRDVQISDLPRSGSMPLSSFFFISFYFFALKEQRIVDAVPLRGWCNILRFNYPNLYLHSSVLVEKPVL